MADGFINIRIEDEEGMCVASSMQVRIPEGTTSFEARRMILQELVHCLDHYAIDEMIGHLKSRNVVREPVY